MKKLFVSIPMTGVEDSVVSRFQDVLEKITFFNPEFSEYEIVPPVDIDKCFDKNGLTEESYEHDTAWYVGRDVELVMHCDAIYSCKGWENSKGCRVERFAAEMYGLKLFEEK